jgi:hypothetical protein
MNLIVQAVHVQGIYYYVRECIRPSDSTIHIPYEGLGNLLEKHQSESYQMLIYFIIKCSPLTYFWHI